jgi:hypothetical protein
MHFGIKWHASFAHHFYTEFAHCAELAAYCVRRWWRLPKRKADFTPESVPRPRSVAAVELMHFGIKWHASFAHHFYTEFAHCAEQTFQGQFNKKTRNWLR